jgi:hypothetical protein
MATEANARYEKRTWPVVKQLAADVPESGIIFQSQPTTTTTTLLFFRAPSSKPRCS